MVNEDAPETLDAFLEALAALCTLFRIGCGFGRLPLRLLECRERQVMEYCDEDSTLRFTIDDAPPV
jgi:hypothetical protein